MSIPHIGRERDKLIAEMKGYKDILSFNNRGTRRLFIRKPKGGKGCPRTALPQWSISRSDAWELWEELPHPKEFVEYIVMDKL